MNTNGEDIASVSDLILDRGSGRVEHIVVKTGSTLGMGGRAVAIPFSSFRWEVGGKDRLVLASTSEQLKQFPEYTSESWKAMKDTAKDDKNALRQSLAVGTDAANDPYAGTLDTAKKVRVEGEITKVDRVRTTVGEQIVITVKTADGTRKVALGPSWYVNGTIAAPMRGDKVAIDTLALPRDPDQLLAGTHLRSGERELHLRNTDGTPAWALNSVETKSGTLSTPYARHLLVSQLPGTRVDCRGEECGKVQDVILDRNSGEIGFLSIDPNQNFLGISDTKRLIPWSVATVTFDGPVRIDASKEMVLASAETPADLATLNSGAHAEQVYKAFDVSPPKFDAAPRTRSAVPKDAGDAWSARGAIITAIERDSNQTLEGKVVDIDEVKFDKGVQPAHAMKIKVAGDGGREELILIGPAQYMAKQKSICKAGDTIKVEASRTMINGKPYWIARSIDCKDKRTELLDGSNAPVWAQR